MGDLGVSRKVRPRTIVIGMVALIVAVALVVLLSLWLRPRHPAAAGLEEPSGDGPVSYAGSFPAEDDDALANPLGITYDGEYLYVAESDAGAIRIFDTDGRCVGTIGLPVADGQRSAYPSSIAVAGERLAVVDNAANRVIVIPAEPAEEAAVELTLGAEGDAPTLPTAVAYARGEYFVADAADGSIRVYGENGKYLRALRLGEATPAGFVTALTESGGVLYAAHSGTGKALAVDVTTGESVEPLGGTYSLPRAVEPVSEELLVVVDGLDRSAHVIDHEGSRLASIDASTVPEGPMSAPRGAAWIADESRLYVTDAGTGQVHVYNIQIGRL